MLDLEARKLPGFPGRRESGASSSSDGIALVGCHTGWSSTRLISWQLLTVTRHGPRHGLILLGIACAFGLSSVVGITAVPPLDHFTHFYEFRNARIFPQL
eukprot:2363964-Prymnesium_polylepis.1